MIFVLVHNMYQHFGSFKEHTCFHYKLLSSGTNESANQFELRVVHGYRHRRALVQIRIGGLT